MLKYIEQLQRKPEAARKRVLFVVITVLMAVIILMWTATLSVRLSGSNTEDVEENGSPPLSVLKEQGGKFYKDFSRGLGEIIAPFYR